MSTQDFAEAKRQNAVLEAALDCVVSIDVRGRVTYFNAAAERTFGYAAEEVLGREMAEVIVPPALRAAHRAGLARHLIQAEVGAPMIVEGRVWERSSPARTTSSSWPPG